MLTIQMAQTTLSWDLLGSVCFGYFSMSSRISCKPSWSHAGSGAAICSPAWGDVAEVSPEDAILGFLGGALQARGVLDGWEGVTALRGIRNV